ncbi:MAG: 30S ribosomal protein S6 [Patescibacteria group bacterium]
MSKIKKENVSHYEMLYIISNKFTEEEAKEIDKKVRSIITENNGNITFSESWGKKRLAYQIKHFSHGYYYLFEFDLQRESLAKIDRTLRMSSEILRHQIITKEVKSTKQIEKRKEIDEKIALKKVELKKEEKEQEQVNDKKKLELKDLDKKLDKILDTDDLL